MTNQKIKILIVDDDSGHRNLVMRHLQRSTRHIDFVTDTAASMKECLDQLENNAPDLVLLDLTLPDCSGIETVDRCYTAAPHTPIVVLTNHHDDQLGIDAIKHGASEYLTKSELNAGVLIRTIRHSLERYETKIQLQKERDLAQNYLDAAAAVFVAIDNNRHVTMINKAGCNILQCTEEQIIGKDWFETALPETSRANAVKIFQDVFAGKSDAAQQYECEIITAKGYEKIIAWQTTAIKDEHGQITGFLSSGTDITLTRITEQQIIEHDRLKSEFVITVSHELRTPLTIFRNIISNALAGVAGKISKKLRSDLEAADKAVSRLAAIISDFLDISRIEAGKMNIDLQPLSLQSVINDTLQMLHPIIDKNNMIMEIELPNDDIRINSDHDKVGQILTKLIENAAKFVPDCGGKVIIRAIDAGDSVEINVEDNGPGISKEDMDRVFDRFVQVEKHVGQGQHGTGLGLTITKDLIELLGGRIWVKNAPIGGANFCFLLPKYNEPLDADNLDVSNTIDSIKEQLDDLAQKCSETLSTSNVTPED